MGQATSISIRQNIVAAHRNGVRKAEIARMHGINYGTVHTICRRYDAQGEAGLFPRYAKCGRSEKSQGEVAFRLVRLMKHLHPGWGVAYILQRIRRDYPGLELQSERQYQRRLRPAGKHPYKMVLPKPLSANRAAAAHDTWQIDAKERFALQDGQGACYLNVTDEATGAILAARVFPL